MSSQDNDFLQEVGKDIEILKFAEKLSQWRRTQTILSADFASADSSKASGSSFALKVEKQINLLKETVGFEEKGPFYASIRSDHGHLRR